MFASSFAVDPDRGWPLLQLSGVLPDAVLHNLGPASDPAATRSEGSAELRSTAFGTGGMAVPARRSQGVMRVSGHD